MFKFSVFSALLVTQALMVWAGRPAVMEATFVTPAAPTVVTRRSSSQSRSPSGAIVPSGQLSSAQSRAISSGYGLYSPANSALHAKKKKAPPAAAKKVQVKLLQHVAGTGQAGQVIQVPPAFFNNKLRPNRLAVIISDEEVAQEQSERNEKDAAQKQKAEALQGKLEELTLKINRKAGPDGQLFGGIGPKVIMEELTNEIADDFLKEKSVKVKEILDQNGKKMRGDIKHTGDFGARINIISGVSSKIGISVKSE